MHAVAEWLRRHRIYWSALAADGWAAPIDAAGGTACEEVPLPLALGAGVSAWLGLEAGAVSAFALSRPRAISAAAT